MHSNRPVKRAPDQHVSFSVKRRLPAVYVKVAHLAGTEHHAASPERLQAQQIEKIFQNRIIDTMRHDCRIRLGGFAGSAFFLQDDFFLLSRRPGGNRFRR